MRFGFYLGFPSYFFLPAKDIKRPVTWLDQSRPRLCGESDEKMDFGESLEVTY